MGSRWVVYTLTLLSYAVIHGIRTTWAAAKKDLAKSPFDFTVAFLGTLDMLLLFSLAIGVSILGPRVTKYGPKKCLMICMVGNIILTALLGMFLALEITYEFVYIILLVIGVAAVSGFGWPSCLCLVSYYFSKQDGVILSAWNGASQLGDLIALGTYFFVLKISSTSWTFSYFFITAYLAIITILNFKLISGTKPVTKDNLPEANQMKVDELQQQNDVKTNQSDQKSNEVNNKSIQKEVPLQKMIQINQSPVAMPVSQKQTKKPDNQAQTQQKVNIFQAWLLPGVALNVLAYGFIKSVNSFIVAWMVFYLVLIGIQRQAFIITILWAISIFIGGLLHGKINKKLNRKWFILALVLSGTLFFVLQGLHLNIYEIQIIIALILCGILYGGPYNLMSTAIPLQLSSHQSIAKNGNARSTIISLMQGFGQLFCGFSLLLVPLFGIGNIHLMGAIYCLLGAGLLVAELWRQKRQIQSAKSPMNAQNHI